MIIFVLIWCLNLGISFWNAYAVGNAWVEAKYAGGWRRFITWMGAIMADIGFTWCTLTLLGVVTNQVGWLNDYSLEILLNLGYVVIIPFLLFAGYAIMLDSWQRAYRQRTVANMGVAGYNTFANAYNTYHAIDGMGDALVTVFDALFGGKRKRGKDEAQLLLIIILFVFSFGFGTIVTWALINRYAGRDEPMPLRQERVNSY